MATKAEKNIAKAMSLFENLSKETGIPLDMSTVEAVSEAAIYEQKEFDTRELDGVMLSLHYPHKLKAMECHWCHLTYMTNYCSVGYCSVYCRKAHFEARFFVKWDRIKVRTWGEMEPAMIIGSEKFAELETWARHLIKEADRVRSLQVYTQQKPQSFQDELEPLAGEFDPSDLIEDEDLDSLDQSSPASLQNLEPSQVQATHPSPLYTPSFPEFVLE